jgi:hypothetical protein
MGSEGITAPIELPRIAVVVELIPKNLAVPSRDRFYLRRLAKFFGFD